jgi:hypothetical protein
MKIHRVWRKKKEDPSEPCTLVNPVVETTLFSFDQILGVLLFWKFLAIMVLNTQNARANGESDWVSPTKRCDSPTTLEWQGISSAKWLIDAYGEFVTQCIYSYI